MTGTGRDYVIVGGESADATVAGEPVTGDEDLEPAP